MRIETCTSYPDDLLEPYRPKTPSVDWQLVVSGYWSSDSYHSGHVAYYLARRADGVWLMDAVERNAELDDVTEEDFEAGRLNDDQLQALWGRSLDEVQNEESRRIVAICVDAPYDADGGQIARRLYSAIRKAGGKIIDEPDSHGLLDPRAR